MSPRVAVSAPGKLILMGEHAAVYGRPALVAALGLRTSVSLEPRREPEIELDLATLGHHEKTDWDRVSAYTRECARRWRGYARDPTPECFSRLIDRDPARVVKLALGEMARALAPARLPGLLLRVQSRLPAGSGFGSSASVAVAVAGALGRALGDLDHERLAAVALEVERRQHGHPSGVDHTTVLRGGILRIEGGAGQNLEVTPIESSPEVLSRLRLFHTGPPAESTGEVVAAVRSRREANRKRFAAILARMETATRSFEKALRPGAEAAEPLEPVRRFQRQLEAIGVVPEGVVAAIRRVQDLGGAAKLSGAGALSADGAGALLVYWPAGAEEALRDALAGYRVLRAPIGGGGFRSEEAAG